MLKERYNPDKLAKVADVMIGTSLKVSEGDKLVVVYNPGGQQLAEIIQELAGRKRVGTRLQCEDTDKDVAFMLGLSPQPTVGSFDEIVLPRKQNTQWANKFAMIGCNDHPNAMIQVPAEARKTFRQALQDVRDIRSQKQWVLTNLPTEKEAELDGVPYQAYLDLYYRVCIQDWREVDEVQDILITEELNPAKELVLTAGEGYSTTYLTMSIDGQTFANSTIQRNIPGSEVFTGPRRGTVDGTLTLPYPVMFSGKVLPNLTLQFREGRVTRCETDDQESRKWVEQVLDTDDGAREVGEVALGTNPALDRPYLNSLYVEKVSGSFHIALGRSYQYTEYAGRPVHVDNGVVSANHLDLTRLMLPQFGGGKIIVDGKVIQQDGRFVDPRLVILNQINPEILPKV